MNTQQQQIWEGRYFVNAVSENPFGHGKTTFALFQPEMTQSEIEGLVKPFGISLEDYEASGADQTFTKEQAEQIKAYLESEYSETAIEIVPASIPGEWVSVSVFAVGGGDDFYMFCNADAYPLPFKIWGYYQKWGDVESVLNAAALERIYGPTVEKILGSKKVPQMLHKFFMALGQACFSIARKFNSDDGFPF